MNPEPQCDQDCQCTKANQRKYDFSLFCQNFHGYHDRLLGLSHPVEFGYSSSLFSTDWVWDWVFIFSSTQTCGAGGGSGLTSFIAIVFKLSAFLGFLWIQFLLGLMGEWPSRDLNFRG